jgi:hypothetical protein
VDAGVLAVFATSFARVLYRVVEFKRSISIEKRGAVMDNVSIIRIVAGALFVVVLFVLIQRRRTRVK